MSGGNGGGAQASHSLAFRVMRLCRPSLHVETSPLKFDPCDLLFGEDLFDDPFAASNFSRHISSQSGFGLDDPSDLTYRNRFLLQHPSDSLGLCGLLVLPQSFGAIYLGETFCSYISINNSSSFEVRDIVIKAEIQTERQRILLLDTSKSPVESIRAGGRYDFIVDHDVKELGAHTLVCTALYSDGDGERKYLPQFFKFIVSNPLSVKTKVRSVKDITFLEACIENHTKSNLYLDQVEFEPTQQWSAAMLKITDLSSKGNSLMAESYEDPILIRSGGGIYNYLYQLKLLSPESLQSKIGGNNVLGKLQITWRTNLGEPGRLQTQQILGNPIVRREIELQCLEIPNVIVLEIPFTVTLDLLNLTDRVLGPFEVWVSKGDDSFDERAIVVNGFQSMTLGEVQPLSSLKFQMNLIATKPGIQKISGITIFDTIEKKSYDSLLESEIFVDVD